MNCSNCGFHNAPGNRFCGSCGALLGPGPTGTGPSSGRISCWNCGRQNPVERVFCFECGERLSASSLPGGRSPMARRESSRQMSLVPIAIGLLALTLLVGGGIALLFNDDGPQPTPTDIAGATSSPEPTLMPTDEPLRTAGPTLVPTEEPTSLPTDPPVRPAPTPDCSTSTVPTSWVNLSGADTSVRVRRGEYWCIHQVVIVPDPNFGEGRIRLRVGGEVLAEATHTSTGQAEYPVSVAPARLVPPRTDVEYRMNCATDFCNAVIQVGYERYEVPAAP